MGNLKIFIYWNNLIKKCVYAALFLKNIGRQEHQVRKTAHSINDKSTKVTACRLLSLVSALV